MLDGLRKRSVYNVAVSVGDLSRMQGLAPRGKSRVANPERQAFDVKLQTEYSRELDARGDNLINGALQISDNPFFDQIKKPGLVTYDKDFTQSLLDSHEQTIEKLDTMMDACRNGDSTELNLIDDAVQSALFDATEDVDAVACLSINPSGYSYPGRHAKHFAMLATTMGTTLGLDKTTLQELGIGCLIHDIGMMAIDRRSFESKKVLELDEFLEIAKHPIKTFDIIADNLDSVPVNARMVAFQIHERFNGEGYPRRREGENIHPLARVAAVADAYTALVSPRPHRPGMLPYFAMEKMVRDTSRGLFDPKVVRSLLETVGLFPLGSFVELTNDYVGRVIRANGKNYAQPIVEVWKKSNLTANSTLVDLANEETLKIVKAISSLAE